MQNNPIITLTSDFGYKDPFAGMMKGVILTINPLANVIDITHGISPHNIKEAALTIGMSHSFFLPKTVHVVAVDPGVGSSRRPILVITDHAYFIGPDKGKLKIITKEKHTELKSHYSQVPDKGLYALLNSTEYLELFTYKGNASSLFDIKVGDIVKVILIP